MMTSRLLSGGFVGISHSRNGGNSWNSYKVEKQLINPSCEVSTLSAIYQKKNITLFSGPTHKSKRTNLKIYTSLDNGKNWNCGHFVANKAMYSDLVRSSDGSLGIIYEKSSWLLEYKVKGIYYKSFDLGEVTGGSKFPCDK